MCTGQKVILRGFSLVTIVFVLLCILPYCSWAADKYPSRPITLVLGTTPGVLSDSEARLMARYLQKYLGVPIVVENRPGGGSGGVCLNYLAQSKPDGYTICRMGNNWLSHVLLGEAAYKWEDLRAVCQYSEFTDGLAVKPDSQWKTFDEFIDYARKNPGVVRYGHPGVGGASHLRMTYLCKTAKLNLVPLPFNSGSNLMTGMLGGHVPIGIYNIGTFKPLMDAGRLKLLFTFESAAEFGFDQSLPYFHKVFGITPTISSPAYILVPGKTPMAIVKVLEGAVERALKEPEFVAGIKKLFINEAFISGEKLEQILPQRLSSYKEVLKEIGLIK
jgi:tripartite-type tricarboxylate transporter receptor subunit TctC